MATRVTDGARRELRRSRARAIWRKRETARSLIWNKWECPPSPVLMLGTLRACLHGGGGPHVGEETLGASPHLSCKSDQIKIRTGGLPHLPGLPHLHVNRPQRWRQRECQKNNRFESPKQQLQVLHAFLYIYLPSLHDYDGKMPNFTTAKFSFSFLTWIWFLGIRLQTIWVAFDKMSWSDRDRDWKNANSLFNRRFRGRRPLGILNSLLLLCHV